MKKTIKYILVSTIISFFFGALITSAAIPVTPKPGTLPGPDPESQTEDGQFTARKILTETLIPQYTVRIIGLIGGLSVLFLLTAGVRLAISFGNDEAMQKAKNQVIYGLVGFLVALLAYSLVTIIANWEFSGTQNPSTGQIFNTAYAENVNPDDLLHKSIDPWEEIDNFSLLPEIKLEGIINNGIKIILAASGFLTLIAIVVAALYYLTSRGEDDKTTKAKHILLYLLIGMAIIAGSYGIITGISKFKFLE